MKREYTLKQIETIILEETLGKPPTIKGEEADAVRARVRKDIEFVEKNGRVIWIPQDR